MVKQNDGEAEGLWNVSLLREAHRNGGSSGEFDVGGSATTPFRRRNANYSEKTCPDSDTVREN